jgi:cytochrome b561
VQKADIGAGAIALDQCLKHRAGLNRIPIRSRIEDFRVQLRNTAERYGAIAKTLHWTVAALVIAAWALGTIGDELPRGAVRATGQLIHMSAGLAILALLVVRLIWRMTDPPPAPEITPFGRWADRAGRFAHWLLYALLAAVIGAGIIAQFADGDALPVFGLFEIASPWTKDHQFAKAVEEIHEVLANALVIVAALHTAAALVHHWLFHDRTLARMLPRVSH